MLRFFVVWGAFAAVLAQVERRCGHPAVPPNARVSLVSDLDITPGSLATYECDEGYELFGARQRECTLRGDWTAEPPFCGTNVAFRKPANQSTTVRGGGAANGNDGEKTTEHDGKRCTETQREASPWWQVDLLRHYAVKVVRVTTRGCCGHQPLQDLEIRVGNSSSDLQRNPLCAWFPGTIDEGVTKTFTCARPLVGQHVFLQLVGVEGSLSLCEVEVFTTEEFSNDRCAPVGVSDDVELAAFSRNCYEFNVARGGSFDEARRQCQTHGGDLIHGFQGATSSFLIQELERRKAQLKTQLVWIGAQKEPGLTSRTWKWVDGEVVSKPAWGKDQPNNYNGEQNCVVLDGGRAWLWNDVGCNLDYLHWICQYMPPSCGSPDKLLNTTIEGDSYKVGAAIAYRCPEGHMLVGDKTRECKKDGFWSGAAPNCKYVNCGGLTAIQDGDVALADGRTTHGARAAYSCRENHTLVGDVERLCGDEGLWTGSAPKCLFDWCPEPPPVSGATVAVGGHKAGSLATYTCQNGFILFGQPSVTCTLGGVWSGTPPSCKYVDCGTPAQVHKGSFRLLNGTTTYGSVAQFGCEPDYWLAGADTLTCNRDGKWSHDIPSCELITCADPEVPAGGYMEAYDYNVHSTIDFHCEPGHLLMGERSLVCQQDGEWSGDSPKCDCKYTSDRRPMEACNYKVHVVHSTIDFHCERSLVCQQDGEWSGDLPKCDCKYTSERRPMEACNYNVHSTIDFHCEPGHLLMGERSLVCQQDGEWSGDSPKCDCKYTSDRRPMEACNYNVHVVHSTIDFHCERSLVCQQDGEWSGDSPKCDCKYTSERRPMEACNYNVHSTIDFHCEPGHLLMGERSLVCQQDGEWSGDSPKCDCKYTSDRRPMEACNYNVRSTIDFHSEPGHLLMGERRLVCQQDGEWSGDSPKCDCKYTSDRRPMEACNYNVRSTIDFHCEPGHLLMGERRLVCQQDGEWSDDSPKCDCKYTSDRRPMEACNYNVRSTIDFHCEPGHLLMGERRLVCQQDGEWSGDSPKCDYVDCGKLPPLPYGAAELLNGTTHLGSVIQYSCTANYRLSGPARRECLPDHTWSDASPRCEEIRCPEPVVAENSIVSVTGNDRMHGRTMIRTSTSNSGGNGNTYRIGALVKYRCERGYKVVGESLSTCEDGGQWSGSTPNCRYVDCGNPGRLENGKVTLATNATYYGATALYECDEHWQLDGVSRRLCQDDGTWSSEAPVCKEITCPDPAEQIKGSVGLHVVTSTRSIRGEAHYRCERGYSLKGNDTRTCLPKGTWSGTPPVCLPIDCRPPGTIDNGRVIIANSSTLFGSSIEYHCLPQFMRVGPFLRKCMDDGHWSGDEPSCEIATNEAAENSTLPLRIGIGCGVVLFLLVLLGAIYLILRKSTPVKNTENIEGAERKEDQNAAVMSYATLHDSNGRNIYDHVTDNVYDSPYSEHLADNAAYGRRSDSDSAYEPEPTGPNAVVTINGVAVR